ncbi:MAG: PAS domain S-box protein [Chthoniobacterales bacterium]
MIRADVTRATEEALHEREITFAALAKVAPVGIMRFDANGRCNYANDRWSEMAGISIDHAIGEGWTKAIHPEDRASVMYRWAQMRAGDAVFREEYRLCRPDGTVTWVFAEGARLRSYSGEELGFIRAVTDITRHRQLEAELTSAREELEERVRERTAALQTEMTERQKLEKQVLELKDSEQTRFSQDLHDGLGQYLTGILFRSVALHRSLNSERSPHTESASKISELVEEAINQAHRLARGIAPVSLRRDGLMSALEELVKTMCQPEVVNCTFECEEPVYLDDNTTATHVYRIAQEAITNAMKHSKGSSVVLRIQRLPDGCELSVRDDGEGFAAGASTRQGRGLNIMKHRARLINGEVQVQPAHPRGTVVICRFPLPAI